MTKVTKVIDFFTKNKKIEHFTHSKKKGFVSNFKIFKNICNFPNSICDYKFTTNRQHGSNKMIQLYEK